MEVVMHTCDRCGHSETQKPDNITAVKIEFSAGSRFSCQDWTFDICDDCMEILTNDFKENIQISECL